MTKTYIFATKNAKKLCEIEEILSGSGIAVRSMDDVGIDLDIEETGETFAENAVIKARAVCDATGIPALADDSGLVIDCLNGEPGVHSARYLGYDTPYEIKNLKILELMKDVPPEKRAARFVCAIAAAFPDGFVIVEQAAVEGLIADKPNGDNGFGYDPILYVPEFRCTTAEMTMEQKNTVSHRGKAMRQMRDRLREMSNRQG